MNLLSKDAVLQADYGEREVLKMYSKTIVVGLLLLLAGDCGVFFPGSSK